MEIAHDSSKGQLLFQSHGLHGVKHIKVVRAEIVGAVIVRLGLLDIEVGYVESTFRNLKRFLNFYFLVFWCQPIFNELFCGLQLQEQLFFVIF